MKKTTIIPAVMTGLAVLLTLSGCGDPKPDRQSLIDAGNRHFWRAEHVEALGPYLAAYEQDRADPDVLFKIGECHFYLGNYREACKWYRQTIKSFPGHQAAADRLAQAQAMLPSFAPEPTPQTGPDVQYTPKPQVVARQFISSARTYEAQGDAERALDSYKKAVQAADDQAFTHAELGMYYKRTGRNAEALTQLKQAQELDPSDAEVTRALGELGSN